MSAPRQMIPGSEHPAFAAATAERSDPAAVIEVTIVLRRRAEPPAAAFVGPPMTRAELAAQYGADPSDLESVRAARRSPPNRSAGSACRVVRCGRRCSRAR